MFNLQAQKRDQNGNELLKNSQNHSNPQSENGSADNENSKSVNSDITTSKDLGSHLLKKLKTSNEDQRNVAMDDDSRRLKIDHSLEHLVQPKNAPENLVESVTKRQRISLIDQILQDEEAQRSVIDESPSRSKDYASLETDENSRSLRKVNRVDHWKNSNATEKRSSRKEFINANSPKIADFEDSQLYLHQTKESPIKSKNLTCEEEEELSIALIRQLQEEEEKEIEYRRKLRLEQDNQDALCSVCFEILVSQKFRLLENCGHIFHDTCLAEFIKTEIKNRKFPLTCPSTDCRIELTSFDINDLIEKKMLEQYYEITLKQYVETHQDEMSCCPTADCKFAFLKEPDQTLFNCPVCKKSYCISCKVDYHRGMTCEEFKQTLDPTAEEECFERFVKKMNFKKCPKCGVWVEKEWGCDHMSCKCGYAFCYNCGKSKGEDKKELEHTCDCYEKMAASNPAYSSSNKL